MKYNTWVFKVTNPELVKAVGYIAFHFGYKWCGFVAGAVPNFGDQGRYVYFHTNTKLITSTPLNVHPSANEPVVFTVDDAAEMFKEMFFDCGCFRVFKSGHIKILDNTKSITRKEFEKFVDLYWNFVDHNKGTREVAADLMGNFLNKDYLRNTKYIKV